MANLCPQLGRFRAAALLAGLLAANALALAPHDLELREQEAFRRAIERVAPSVVRIETVGGLERVSGVLMGTAPTSGVVVDPAGYIVSSAFAFAHRPASILVRLPDGTRKPAEVVATDHSRMLVLLKIETELPLPVPEPAPESEIRVGQWAIAVGRAFTPDEPNMTAGIVSARNRIWGKAIQTDAALSPNNYGGALVDICGRLLGVIVPLSPQADNEVAGVEWYDSGIGFAIPAEHILKILPRWQRGEDLYPGLLGISLPSALYTAEAVIAACQPGSPAADAGLKQGDKIVEIEGRPVGRAAEAKQEISRRYAGEKLHLVVLRGTQRLEFDVELVAKLAPYEHPFLGILPRRDDQPGAVTVRYVYPQSPAAQAGIEPGDVILALEGEAVEDRHALAVQLSRYKPGQALKLRLRRAGREREVEVTLARVPEDLPPAELPAAHDPLQDTAQGAEKAAGQGPGQAPARSAAGAGAAAGDSQGQAEGAAGPRLGLVPLKIPELPNEAFAYVPPAARQAGWCGVVVWVPAPGEIERQAVVARWKALCDAWDLILVVPQSNDPARWQPAEAVLVQKLIDQARANYEVDPARIVVGGFGEGANVAWLAARRHPELVRGAVAVEVALAGPPPDNDPLRRLAVFATVGAESDQVAAVRRFVEQCREKRVPVTLRERPGTPGDLDAGELAELVRWIDMLDRI